jgi:hypothetical protein
VFGTTRWLAPHRETSQNSSCRIMNILGRANGATNCSSK